MRKCSTCQKTFEGRSNQKFCSTKCKNSFHNEENKIKEAQVKAINKILHKNWTILQQLFDLYRSAPISKDIIEAYGFNDKYLTHVYISPNGESYKMIYDMAYKPHYDDQIQIVKLED